MEPYSCYVVLNNSSNIKFEVTYINDRGRWQELPPDELGPHSGDVHISLIGEEFDAPNVAGKLKLEADDGTTILLVFQVAVPSADRLGSDLNLSETEVVPGSRFKCKVSATYGVVTDPMDRWKSATQPVLPMTGHPISIKWVIED